MGDRRSEWRQKRIGAAAEVRRWSPQWTGATTKGQQATAVADEATTKGRRRDGEDNYYQPIVVTKNSQLNFKLIWVDLNALTYLLMLAFKSSNKSTSFL